MDGLLPDSICGKKKVNPRWTVEQTTILLNMWFSGVWSEMRIAKATNRTVDGVIRRIWEFWSNYRDRRPIDYIPVRRHSRVDCRWNENERLFLINFKGKHKKTKKSVKYLSAVMQRTAEEIEQVWSGEYWPGMKIQPRHRTDEPVVAKYGIGNKTSVSAIKARRLLKCQ